MASRPLSTSECFIHVEDTRFFCLTCNRRVCDECIIGDCRNHNIIKAKKPIEERRTSTSLKLEQFQKDCYPLYQGIERIEAESELIQGEIDNVMKRAELLKETVDKIGNELVHELSCSKQENDNFLQSEKEAVKEIEAFLNESLSSVSSLEEPEIDRLEERLKELQTRQRKSQEQRGTPKFVTSSSKDVFTALKSLFGDVTCGVDNKVKGDQTPVQTDDDNYLIPVSRAPEIPPRKFVESVCSFSMNFSPGILSVANKCLFVASGMEIHEVKSNDKIVRIKSDVNFEINGFIVKSSKEILISSKQKPGIFKLQQKQRHPLIPKDKQLSAMSYVDPTPYHPTCMSLCQSEKDILVALQSNQQDKPVKLQKYPLYQDKDFKFENVSISAELNLTRITGVVETVGGDICLIDEIRAGTSHVICVDSTGEPRFRYPTDDKIKRYFVGICVLKCGIIVLADSCVMSGIHLIDGDGKLILFKRMNSKPTCLATEEEFIWVGYNDNKVEKLSASSLIEDSNLA